MDCPKCVERRNQLKSQGKSVDSFLMGKMKDGRCDRCTHKEK